MSTHLLGLVSQILSRRLPIAFAIIKTNTPDIERVLEEKALDKWPNARIILPCAENCNCGICQFEKFADSI